MLKYLRFVGPIVSLALFAIALVVLGHELQGERIHDVIVQVARIPHRQLALALLATAGSFAVLTGYDWLSVRYVRKPLPYRRVALASFVNYAFSQALGLPLVTGGAMRLRLYTGWGLNAFHVTQVVAFASFSFWLGVLLVGGVVFSVVPAGSVAALLHLPVWTVHPIGYAALLLVASYLLWSAFGRRVLRVRRWRMRRPSPRLALGQLVVAATDWVLASSVLYLLLPPELAIGFPAFLGIFLIAFVAGIVSAVPGGIGVFEGVLLFMLPSRASDAAVLGALVAYRVVYYLVPLVAAAACVGAYELIRGRRALARSVARFGTLGRWVPAMAPSLFALTTFAGGVILLVSGATPGTVGRMRWVNDLLPLPVIEASHFLASVAGMGLVLLALGLQRRLDAAYQATLALLAGGIVFSLLKGLDYEEAAALSIMLLALRPARRHFYRRASLLAEPWTPGWVVAVVVVLAGTIWLGFFSYANVAYRNELWWRFALHADAPRFLRASVGIVALTTVFGVRHLLRAAPPTPRFPTREDLDRVEAIARGARDTMAYLALLGDKSVLFSASGRAFLMYAVSGRTWIALGDPVGPAEEHAELAWRFDDLAHRHDARTAFYLVTRNFLPLYIELGMTLFKIGEEARVDAAAFSLDGKARKRMRNFVNGLTKAGVTVEFVPRGAACALLPRLHEISDAWLAEKHTREKGFSLGRMDDAYLARLPLAVVWHEGRIVAFANVLEGGDREELSIDLMRYDPATAPENVMEFLLVHLILRAKAEGYRWFSLGMAPLSGLETGPRGPKWNRVGALVFRLGEHFYNFRGLRMYKEKFDPQWQSRYVAVPGGVALPRVLTDVATLIAGGVRGVVLR